MGDHSGRDNGQNIGDIVRSALHTGDLTKLRHLGPAVENAVRDLQVNVEKTVRDTTRAAVGGQDGRGARPQDQGGQPPKSAPRPAQQVRPVWQGSAPPAKRRAMPGAGTGVAQVALGVLGVVAFGLCSVIFALLAATLSFSTAFWPLSAVFGGATLACALVLGAGVGVRSMVKRVWQYYTLLDDKKVVTYEELAAKTGIAPRDIRRDVRRARKRNLLPDLHTDAGETCLMRGEETYRLYLETEKARLEREQEEAERLRRLDDPVTADLERFRAEGQETIRKIREANEAIPGEEVSEKLSRLEAACARIFAYVEKHPDKLPDCRKFMSYYLPTTLKLVEKYRQYEAMEQPPANILKAKQEIGSSLDTVVEAFNTLFENLYHEDTLDVSTDIEVLEKMLEQEGLTGKGFNVEAEEGP